MVKNINETQFLERHSVIFRPILAKSEPFFGKLNNSAQSEYFFMISKVGSTTMIGLSCQTIMRSNQTSRLSSTTPGSEMSDMGNLDQQNQRFSRNSLYKSCSKYHKLLKKTSYMVIKTLLSSTDPIREQEDGCSLDEENERFLRNSLYKSCSKYHTVLI